MPHRFEAHRVSRSEKLVVAIFVVVLAAWLIVHGLHQGKPVPKGSVAPATAATSAAR